MLSDSVFGIQLRWIALVVMWCKAINVQHLGGKRRSEVANYIPMPGGSSTG